MSTTRKPGAGAQGETLTIAEVRNLAASPVVTGSAPNSGDKAKSQAVYFLSSACLELEQSEQ